MSIARCRLGLPPLPSRARARFSIQKGVRTSLDVAYSGVTDIEPMTQSSKTILVSVRHAGSKMPCVIGPSADKTLADVRSIVLYSLGIPDSGAEGYKLFAGAVELVDLTETVGHLAAGERVLRLDLGATPNVAAPDPRFELTPDQVEKIMRLEAEAAEFRTQMQRVGIDGSIMQFIGERGGSTSRRSSKGNTVIVEQEYVVDKDKESAALRALRELPDGAGKEAFLAAYNNRLRSGD
jgi:hypothetical protein